MVDPDTNDSEITALSDEYIRELQPEGHRYDITLAPDFVISVLPNGIKTWAFIYDFQGRNRRRTLGVFPEMDFEDARTALAKSRDNLMRMDEPTVSPEEMGKRPAVLGGGAYIPKKEASKPEGWRRLLLALLILGVIGAAGGFWYASRTPPKVTGSGTDFDSSRPFSMTTNQPAAPTSNKPGGLPFAVGPKEPAGSAPEDAPAPQSGQSRTLPFDVPPKKTAGDKSGSSAAPVTPPPAPDRNRPPPVTTAPGSSTTSATPSPDVPAPTTGSMAGSGAADMSGNATPATNTSGSAGPDAVRNIPRPAAQTSPRAAVATPAPTRTSSAPATGSSSRSASPTPTNGATAYGGSVARSTLTSKVVELEPTDVLGPEISYKDSGFTRVFYFTELREFSDGHIVHRWERNGEITNEVRLKVQKSWRWRTYSNKDIPAGLTGKWRVSTIDASGAVLDSLEFTYGFE